MLSSCSVCNIIHILLVNRDRHGANVEVVLADDGYRLAPVFDSGLSLVFSAYGDEVRAAAFDPLSDVSANNYLGTRSLFENLKLIDAPLDVEPLSSAGLEDIMEGLEGVLPQAHRAKVEQIIRERWNYAVARGVVRGGLL